MNDIQGASWNTNEKIKTFLREMNTTEWEKHLQKEMVTIHYANHNTAVHTHDFVEIVYFTHGVGTHHIGGQIYNVSPGAVCVMNPNVKHYYGVDSNYCNNLVVKNLVFYPQLLNCDAENFLYEFCEKKASANILASAQPSFCHLLQDPDRKIEKCFSLIENEMLEKQENYLEVVKCLIETILLLLLSDRKNQIRGKKYNKSYIVIEGSIEYLNQHIQNTPTMKNIAMQFGFSPEYYSKLFREFTGMSYNRFVSEMKCNAACQLLLESDYTNEIIAEATGFATLKSFYQHFKECKGVTPREYVKQNTL